MKRFSWTVELTVDETWVEDGFDLTDESAKDMLALRLPYAYGSELKARVVRRPADKDVAECQGYNSVEEYLGERDGRTAATRRKAETKQTLVE
jgi:hypothetical protein